jgi:hypothetical protein
VLVEIGGTVGDIEALPFFEAIRQLGNDLPRGSTSYMHLTLVPFIPSAGELKTKPTQHSVKELRGIGIQPDILLCRADREIPASERRKIALFCNVREEAVIQALDVSSIYDVPLAYHREGLDREVLSAFGLEDRPAPDLSRWEGISKSIANPEGEVTIAIVGKYTGLKGRLQVVDGGPGAWRHCQPGAGQFAMDRVGSLRGRTLIRILRAFTVSWFPAALVSAARKARFWRSSSRESGVCRISGSASACRWRASRRRERRNSRSSMVHRRSIPSGTEVAAVRTASAVCLVHRGCA